MSEFASITQENEVTHADLVRRVNALERRVAALEAYWVEDDDDVTEFMQDMGACVDCPKSEGCPAGTCTRGRSPLPAPPVAGGDER